MRDSARVDRRHTNPVHDTHEVSFKLDLPETWATI
jgi:hypothetical protein